MMDDLPPFAKGWCRKAVHSFSRVGVASKPRTKRLGWAAVMIFYAALFQLHT